MAGAMFAACDIRELTTYEGGVYVNFANPVTDSTVVSFMLNPGKDVVDVNYEMELVGIASASDLEYRIVVDEELTTAPSDCYVIPDKFTFRAGNYTEQITIGVKKTGDLNTRAARLVLRVEGMGGLGIGKLEKSTAIIWLTNSVTQPSWWDWEYSDVLFGTYSNSKYILLIELFGAWDFSKATIGDDGVRALALEFGRFIKESEPLYDENNQLITSPMSWI